MKSIYSVLLLSLAVVVNAYGFDKYKEAFTKSVEKEYEISQNGKVELFNQYGNIEVKTNDGDKVTIDVTIIVNADNEENANKAFERINIEFNSNADYVKAETILESESSSWWGGSKKSYDFKINYEVTVPKTVNMNVKNKYGDVYITELDNDLDLDVRYGNFNVASAEELDLTCKYGSGEIGTCSDITADLGYVSGEGLKIGTCETAVVDSKYSKIRIDNAKSIKADAGYDNYEIGTVNVFKLDGNYNEVKISDVSEFVINTKYTKVNIEELRASADVEMGYGGIEIYKLHKGFSSVDVESNYGSVKIGAASDAAYNFILDASYAGVSVPENANITVKDKSGNSNHVEGSVGSNPSGSIKVTSDYGSIKIR